MGNELIALFRANHWLGWTIFWLVWLFTSSATLAPGLICFMVGYVFYRERAFNLYSLAALYVGACLMMLLFGDITRDTPEQVRLWMGWAMLFAVVVLAIRYPMLRLFVFFGMASAARGRRHW